MDDKSCNITDAARTLGVDPGTIRRWVARKGLQPVKTTSFGMWFKQRDIREFADKAGISLSRDRHHPDHYTPPTLAAAINAGNDENESAPSGVTATTIRQMIAASEIKILSVPNPERREGRKGRTTLLIDQAEGLRVIAQFAKAGQKAG